VGHFVACLSIVDLINARKMEHIGVTKKVLCTERKGKERKGKEATKLFFQAIAASCTPFTTKSRFDHK